MPGHQNCRRARCSVFKKPKWPACFVSWHLYRMAALRGCGIYILSLYQASPSLRVRRCGCCRNQTSSLVAWESQVLEALHKHCERLAPHTSIVSVRSPTCANIRCLCVHMHECTHLPLTQNHLFSPLPLLGHQPGKVVELCSIPFNRLPYIISFPGPHYCILPFMISKQHLLYNINFLSIHCFENTSTNILF